jgi:hypothetical protein
MSWKKFWQSVEEPALMVAAAALTAVLVLLGYWAFISIW